jgi:hypothetical protein
MVSTPIRLSDLLRTGAPRGAPVEIMLDSWDQVEDAVLADSAHAREALSAASAALPSIGGAVGERRSLAAAVLDVRGQVCFADPRLPRAVPRVRRPASAAAPRPARRAGGEPGGGRGRGGLHRLDRRRRGGRPLAAGA